MTTAPQTANQDQDRASVRLLPLSKDPFQAPTDRDMLPSERRLFVQTHRTCVFGYDRRSDGPAMSIVYYVPDENDDLLVATMGERAKAKAVARNGKVSLCVLDETWPFAYLQVYCDAVIEDDEETLITISPPPGGGFRTSPMPPVSDERAQALIVSLVRVMPAVKEGCQKAARIGGGAHPKLADCLPRISLSRIASGSNPTIGTAVSACAWSTLWVMTVGRSSGILGAVGCVAPRISF